MVRIPVKNVHVSNGALSMHPCAIFCTRIEENYPLIKLYHGMELVAIIYTDQGTTITVSDVPAEAAESSTSGTDQSDPASQTSGRVAKDRE